MHALAHIYVYTASSMPLFTDYSSAYKYNLDWLPPSQALTLHPAGVLLPFPPLSVEDVVAVAAAAGTASGSLPGTGPAGASSGAVGGGIIPLGASDRGNASSSDVFLTIRIIGAASGDVNDGDTCE